MDDAAVATSPAPPRRPIWQRPVSRRAVLATGATGATAAALAVLWKGNDLSQILDHVRDLTHGYRGALSSERVRVAHLLRRSGFGATKAELDHFAAMGQTAATEAILNYSKTSNAALASQLPTIDLGGTPQPTAAAIQAWWLQRMAQSARPLEEKLTLFWHGLLTSGLDKAGPAQLFTQNQLFRGMALGNFDDLLKAVSKDPAMMVYLDTETNRKGKPNENYARELMELFTTGIGHYSEDDVRESARAFTGWTLGRGKQRDALSSTFVGRYHLRERAGCGGDRPDGPGAFLSAERRRLAGRCVLDQQLDPADADQFRRWGGAKGRSGLDIQGLARTDRYIHRRQRHALHQGRADAGRDRHRTDPGDADVLRAGHAGIPVELSHGADEECLAAATF